MSLLGLQVVVLLAVASVAGRAMGSSEMTFELPDNAEQCFHEEIGKGTRCTLEFQVCYSDSHYTRLLTTSEAFVDLLQLTHICSVFVALEQVHQLCRPF